MRQRIYGQTTDGRRICPHCGGSYSTSHISRHAYGCAGPQDRAHDSATKKHSSGGANVKRQAARDLIASFGGARPRGTHADRPFRCAQCGSDHHAPSVADPRVCGSCAASRYAWKRTSFGRMRMVPPRLAQRWPKEIDHDP